MGDFRIYIPDSVERAIMAKHGHDVAKARKAINDLLRREYGEK